MFRGSGKLQFMFSKANLSSNVNEAAFLYPHFELQEIQIFKETYR